MQYQQIFVHVAAPELQRHVVLPVRIDPELEFDAAALPGGRGAGQKDSGGLIQTAPDDFAAVALQPVTFFGTGFAELNRVVNCRPGAPGGQERRRNAEHGQNRFHNCGCLFVVFGRNTFSGVRPPDFRYFSLLYHRTTDNSSCRKLLSRPFPPEKRNPAPGKGVGSIRQTGE